MIKAAHNPLFEAFFGAYLFVHMRKSFRKITLENKVVDRRGPVLLIGNHFSWWDGFIVRHVNKRIFKRRLHLMMDEEQLEKRRFLSRLGAFSIRKNSRSALESLQYAADVLKDPDNLLVLFPQGRFQSLHQHPVNFEKGWYRILKQAPPNVQLVFMASLIDYFAYSRPHLTVYLQDFPFSQSSGQPDKHLLNTAEEQHAFSNGDDVEHAYNEFLKRCIEHQNRKSS